MASAAGPQGPSKRGSLFTFQRRSPAPHNNNKTNSTNELIIILITIMMILILLLLLLMIMMIIMIRSGEGPSKRGSLFSRKPGTPAVRLPALEAARCYYYYY